MYTLEEQKKLYDASCKEVLSEKGILAHIMHTCMVEFRDILPGDIAERCIEGTPAVASVPVLGDSLLRNCSKIN